MHVLSAFSPASQEYAAKMLEERGVQLLLGTRVKEIGTGHVLLSDGTRIPTHTVIWAGGLKAASLSDNLGLGGKIHPGGPAISRLIGSIREDRKVALRLSLRTATRDNSDRRPSFEILTSRSPGD